MAEFEDAADAAEPGVRASSTLGSAKNDTRLATYYAVKTVPGRHSNELTIFKPQPLT